MTTPRKILIFNNLSHKKEELKLLVPGEVKFYSCGPTTYDFLHIGNARALVTGDFIYRALLALDYKVTFVRNYTDVDDKIIKRAQEKNENALDYAKKFIQECNTDIAELNMKPPTFTPTVSESMKEIIKMISDILDQGKAYVKDGEVLFKTKTALGYGKLSKKDLSQLSHGKRVKQSDKKDNEHDFVLWKPAKEGEVSWESPWGQGRPGWHIECSAMAKKFLGPTIDLHHGGVDLIFPHHENEIAQSEAANQCTFCDNWVHNEFLNFGKEKMAKSLGNVIKIRDFTKQYTGQVLRHILLSIHYRSRLEWDEKLVSKAVDEVTKINNFVLEIKTLTSQGDYTIRDYKEEVLTELANDFNSAKIISLIFILIREVSQNKDNLSSESINRINQFTKLVQEQLGLISPNPERTLDQLAVRQQDLTNATISEIEIETLIAERSEAKTNKNWTRADAIRDQLKKHAIELQDHADGSISWTKATT